MPSFYEEMQELADELLTADDDNFGQSKTGNIINILTKAVSSLGASALDEDVITWPATLVKGASRGTDLRRDGERLFGISEKVFTIYAKDVAKPTLEDKIEEAGLEYSIVEVSEPSNDGTQIVFYVYVKR